MANMSVSHLSSCSGNHRRRALPAPPPAHQGEGGGAAVQGRRRRRRLQHGRQRLVQPGGTPGLRGGAHRRLPAGGAPRLRAAVRLGGQGQRQHGRPVHGAAQDQPRRRGPEPDAEPQRHQTHGHVGGVMVTEFRLSDGVKREVKSLMRADPKCIVNSKYIRLQKIQDLRIYFSHCNQVKER